MRHESHVFKLMFLDTAHHATSQDVWNLTPVLWRRDCAQLRGVSSQCAAFLRFCELLTKHTQRMHEHYFTENQRGAYWTCDGAPYGSVPRSVTFPVNTDSSFESQRLVKNRIYTVWDLKTQAVRSRERYNNSDTWFTHLDAVWHLHWLYANHDIFIFRPGEVENVSTEEKVLDTRWRQHVRIQHHIHG